MTDAVYLADWVLPVSSPPIRRGAVEVRAGRIHAVGRREEVLTCARPDAARLEHPSGILVPGLVNAHTHLEYTVVRELLDGLEYLDWIATLTKLKYTALPTETLLASARLGALECLRSGVTTLGEQTERGMAVRAIRESGLRSVCWMEVFGQTPAEARESLAALPDRIEAARDAGGPLCRVGVTPHTPWTSGEELLRGTARMAAREDLPLAIHAAESPHEMRLLEEGRGRLADSRRGKQPDWHPPGLSPVAWLDRLEFWEAPPPVQAVHLVHALPEDWDILARRGASAALCPRSNLALGVGRAPVSRAAASGVAVGIGTDSAASSGNLDLLEEARALLREARAAGSALRASDVLRWITLDGARSLGLGDRIGSLEPGKEADLAVFGLDHVSAEPFHDPAGCLLWRGRGSDAVTVVVGGELLLRDAAPTAVCRLDEASIRHEVQAAGPTLAAEAEELRP